MEEKKYKMRKLEKEEEKSMTCFQKIVKQTQI